MKKNPVAQSKKEYERIGYIKAISEMMDYIIHERNADPGFDFPHLLAEMAKRKAEVNEFIEKKESIVIKKKDGRFCDYGFQYRNQCVAGRCKGYEVSFPHVGDSETLWITIDISHQKLHLCNKFECEGALWEQSIPIPDNINLNEDSTVIAWVNEQIKKYE